MQNKIIDRSFNYIKTTPEVNQKKVLINKLELVGTDPGLECGNEELEHIMRWADDGGSLIDTPKSILNDVDGSQIRKHG